MDRRLEIAVVVLLLIGLFGGLHLMDLRGEEPRRALVAFEMLRSGDYMQPTIQGWAYYNKPPLFNWTIAGLYRLFGSQENWVVRLPSLLLYSLTCLGHYLYVRREQGHQIAFLAATISVANAHLLYFGTVLSGELDLFYAAIVYAQVLCIAEGFCQKKWLALFLGSYLLLGLGFLTKGLPSIAFQGLTLLTFSMAYSRWRWLFSWQHIVGGLLGLFPVVAFFYAHEQQTGQSFRYLFNLLEEASQKSAAESGPAAILLHLLEFPLQVIINLLPWSIVVYFLLSSKLLPKLRKQPVLWLGLLFVVGNIWIYWLSPGNRDRYLYPFFPFLASLLAWALLRRRPTWYRPALWLLLVMSLARVAYNYTVIPVQQRSMDNIKLYRAIYKEGLQLASGDPIHTYGTPDSIFVNPGQTTSRAAVDTILSAAYMPYQIPFYLGRTNEQIVTFDTLISPGILYLTTEASLPSGVSVEGKRFSVWNGRKLRFFRYDTAGSGN